MKKKSLNVMWTMLTASAMFFAGCSNDNEGQTNEVKGKADLTIQLTNAGISRASTGTEPGTDAEKEVKNYEVWVYQTADITANPATAAPVGYRVVDNNSSTILANVPATGVRVIVAANYAGVIGEVSYATLVEKMASYVYAYPTATTQPAIEVPASGFEMSGMEDASLQPDQTNTVKVGLKRLVSKHYQPKFTANNLEDNTGSIDYSELNTLFGLTDEIDATTLENVAFEAKNYTFVNGNDKSKLFESGTWVPALNNHLGSAFSTGGGYEYNYTAFDNNKFLTYITGTGTETPVYAYENTPLKANIDANGNLEILADQDALEFDGYHNQSIYAFVIEGELTYENTSITRYWRVNIAKTTGEGTGTTDNYTIYRNGAYKVTVSNIYSIGYNTPKEAEETQPVIPPSGQTNIKVVLDVLDWDIYTENTSM